MPIARRLMDLVGSNIHGPGQPPSPPTLYAVHWHNDSVHGEKPTGSRLLFATGQAPDHDPKAHLVHVFAADNDGHDLLFGYPNEWRFSINRTEALRLAWHILWTWRVRTDWFGLRRWIYYRALHRVVSGPAATRDGRP